MCRVGLKSLLTFTGADTCYREVRTEEWHALQGISQFCLPPTRLSVNSMNHAFASPAEAGPHFTDLKGMEG